MKKFLSLILALVMVLSCASFIFAEEAVTAENVDATATVDETASKYYDAVKFLVNYGIMHGKGDTLGVYDNIKRYEMALFTGRIMTGWTDDTMWEDGSENYSVFSDLAGTAAEKFYGAISYANQNGVIVGVGGSKFAPEAGIKYEDALTMVVRALGYNGLEYPWGYIEKAVALGLTAGINDGVNTPDEGVAYTDTLKREVVAQIIYNALFATTAAGDTLAYRNFGLDLSYANVVITANDHVAFVATASLAPNGYVTYQMLNADGSLDDKMYYAPAEVFGLTADHAADVALGVAYKTIFNNGDIAAVESLEMEAVVNAGLNSKEAGKYPIQNFLGDYKVVESGAANAFAANGSNIYVYTAGMDSEYYVTDIVAVDWNTGNILVKDENGVYQVEWYYNQLLNQYFKYKKVVTANGDIQVVGIEYLTPADIYAIYGDTVGWDVIEVENVYGTMKKVPTDAYASLRIFDTDGDGAAEYGIYEAYAFGKYSTKVSTCINPATSTKLEYKNYQNMLQVGIDYPGKTYAGVAGFGDGHVSDVGGPNSDGAKAPASDYTMATSGAPVYGEGPWLEMYHQGQLGFADVESDVFLDYTYAAEGTIGENALLFALGGEYIYTGNGYGGAYKQFTGKTSAANLWSQEGKGLAVDADGNLVKGYIIYGINPTTGELTVAKTIGAYEEGAESYVATGVLRSFNMDKKTVTIGDETFSITYDELKGAAFNSNHWSGYGFWPEGSAYLYSLFNQFVEYVVVDGKVVWVEASGAESTSWIIVDGFAGISSDGYIVITGYNTADGKLGYFRIASYDGWKLGDFFYYNNINYNWFAEQGLFEEGAMLKIQSYNPEQDAYNVKVVNGIRTDATRGDQKYSTDGLDFTWFEMDFTYAQAGMRMDWYLGKVRKEPKNWANINNGGHNDAPNDRQGTLGGNSVYDLTKNITENDLYILVFADGEVAGSPVRTFKGAVKDPSWFIKGWRLAGPDGHTHIFVGLRAENVNGFGINNYAGATLGIWFKDYTPEDPGTVKMANGFGNMMQLWIGDASSAAYDHTGYITTAAYDSYVANNGWYLLGNTQYQITMLDLRTLSYITVTTDSKDLEPWRVYDIQDGRVVGTGYDTADVYKAICGTFNAGTVIDLDNDTVGAVAGEIDTTGKFNYGVGQQVADNTVDGGMPDKNYVWYECAQSTINQKITKAYFGHAYTYLPGYTTIAGSHTSVLVAIADYEGETQFCLYGGADNSKDNMTSMYYPVTSNRNYGEYPVKRDGEVRGSLAGSWYNTDSNLAKFFGRSNQKADYVIDYVTVVNMDNIRRGKNLAPYAVGFALVTYVFDHESTNH